MPIIVVRGHQIHIKDEATASGFDLVFSISRPMARYAFFGSIYMTTVITFERYCGKNLIWKCHHIRNKYNSNLKSLFNNLFLTVGLVHPLRHFSRSTRRARVYTIPVGIMSFILVSPDLLKYVFVKSTVS